MSKVVGPALCVGACALGGSYVGYQLSPYSNMADIGLVVGLIVGIVLVALSKYRIRG